MNILNNFTITNETIILVGAAFIFLMIGITFRFIGKQKLGELNGGDAN